MSTGGPPAGLHHVEADGAGEPVGLGDTLLDTVRRDARTAVAVALLVEGVHPERDAMREQRGAAGVVEGGEPVPKRVVVLGQLGLPGLVPLGDRLGGGAVLQVGRLDGEEHMPHRGFQACAGRAVLEGVEAELVQQRRQGDARVVRHRVAQRQRAVGRQLTHEPLGQRPDGVVAAVVVIIGLAAADGDDGALHVGSGRYCPAGLMGLRLPSALRRRLASTAHPPAGHSRDRL